MRKKIDYETTKPGYLSFWSILFVLSVVGIIIMLRKFVCFHGDMLFWFFASTSQSMAAMFAVGGVFAVFRFQAQEAKLRNLYDVYKKWFEDIRMSIELSGYDHLYWKDNQIVSKGRELVKERREFIMSRSIEKSSLFVKGVDELEERLDEIENNEKKKDAVLKSVKHPMLVILITFMISIGSLPFTSYISKSFLGLSILILTMALITYSIWCVFTFIRFSLSLK